jgi:uncharacterized protein (TIGR00255 family)
MPLNSMTGFGRSDGNAGLLAWVWEVRSVNGRGLELRLRLPPGMDALEPKLREIVARRINRGNLNVTLTTRQTGSAQSLKLNEQVLDDLLRVVETVRARVGGPMPAAEALLNHRGLIEPVDVIEDEATGMLRTAAMLTTFERALDGLAGSRAAEGQRLAEIVENQLVSVERLVGHIARAPSRSIPAVAQRLKDQVERLLEASGHVLDPSRLHQEAALLATRIDVEEEIKRLGAHVAAARDLLAAAEPTGRKFDFLTQEFNREANTICSKANDPEITRAGLELKAVIDQMREQVQNVE